jgi:hypothetical protein
MKKVRIPQPWEGPLAFKRTFWSIVVVLLIVSSVATMEVLSTPTPKREKLSSQHLSSEMANALLSVKMITLTVVPETGYQGGTISADVKGNYDVDLTETSTSRDVNVRTIGWRTYFNYGRQQILGVLTSGAEALPQSLARHYASMYANHWFETGFVSSSTHKTPPEALSVGSFFSSLGVGAYSQFYTEAPVTVDNILTIPLVTGQITWFVPTSGSLLPNEIVVLGSNPIPLFNSGAGAFATYSSTLIAIPAHVENPTSEFDKAWNQAVTTPDFGRLTPTGLIWESAAASQSLSTG